MASLKNKIDNFIIILLSILPLALASGPAIIEIVVFLIIVLFFFSTRTIKFEKIDAFILFLYFFLVLSSFFSDFKIHSLSSSVLLIRFILLYFIFKTYFLSNSKSKIINFTLITLSITFVILIFDGLTQYFFNLSLFGTELIDDKRMTMHFRSQEYIMGSYISKMIPIFLGLWYLKYENLSSKINLFLLVLLALVFFCMILSNDRAATYLIFLFIFGLILLSKLKSFYKVSSIISVLLIISLVLNFIPSIKERYITETFDEIFGNNDMLIAEDIEILKGNHEKTDFLNFKINDKNIFIFSTAHEGHIKTALNMFFHNPLIGVGPNNFRNLCMNKDFGIYEERGCSTHPHHILSQILAETGIVGFLFYLIILCYLTFKLFKNLFLQNTHFNLSCIYLFYFLIILPFLPSGNIFNNWYLYSLTLPFFYLGFVK